MTIMRERSRSIGAELAVDGADSRSARAPA